MKGGPLAQTRELGLGPQSLVLGGDPEVADRLERVLSGYFRVSGHGPSYHTPNPVLKYWGHVNGTAFPFRTPFRGCKLALAQALVA